MLILRYFRLPHLSISSTMSEVCTTFHWYLMMMDPGAKPHHVTFGCPRIMPAISATIPSMVHAYGNIAVPAVMLLLLLGQLRRLLLEWQLRLHVELETTKVGICMK